MPLKRRKRIPSAAGEKGKVATIDKKSFIVPEREHKELAKRGKLDAPTPEERKTEIRREETEKLDREEIKQELITMKAIKERGVGFDKEPEEVEQKRTLGQSITEDFFTPPIVGQIERGEVIPEFAAEKVGLGLGAAGLALGGAALAGALAVPTAVATSQIIGKLSTKEFPALGVKIAKTYATNPKSIALTSSLLKKIGASAGSIIAIIGSYPFAGFIKEEALQTLSFGFTAANKNNDLQGMQDAIAMQEEVLNPQVWEQIIATIPFANVVKQLKTFYEAAAIKVQTDKRIFEKKAGLTND